MKTYPESPVTLALGRTDDQILKRARSLERVQKARLAILINEIDQVMDLELFSALISDMLVHQFLGAPNQASREKAILALKARLVKPISYRLHLDQEIPSIVENVNRQLLTWDGIKPSILLRYQGQPWSVFQQKTGLKMPTLVLPLIQGKMDIRAWAL